jgi:hypothetical protein
MIERSSLLSLNFYKKEPFTGSYEGMRYRIEKKEKDGESLLCATTYPYPFCFTATKEEDKTSADFPFSEDGMEEAVAWLNEQYVLFPQKWVKKPLCP